MSCTIPREALESFVRVIMPDIIAFFESEEGQREYEEWLKTEEGNRYYEEWLKTEEGQKTINKTK